MRLCHQIAWVKGRTFWVGEMQWVHPRSLKNPNHSTWFSLSGRDFQQHVMNNLCCFQNLCFLQSFVYFLKVHQQPATKSNIILQLCIICWDVFFLGCPWQLLRGDTSSELGIFEKHDWQIRNCALWVGCRALENGYQKLEVVYKKWKSLLRMCNSNTEVIS